MTKQKTFLRNVVAVAICLAGTTMFSGCDNGNDPNEQTGKLVSRVSFSYIGGGDDFAEVTSANSVFKYDDQNRIIEIADYFILAIGKKATFTYSANEMKMIAGFNGGGDTEWNGKIDYTAQLDENGFIKSAVSIWRNLDTNEEDVVSWTATYSNGFLNKLTYPDRTTNFTWNNGNLVKIETQAYGETETLNISYDYTLENNLTNLDINWTTNVAYWYLDDMLEPLVLPQLEFFGQRSKNLIKKVTITFSGGYESETYNYQYKFDKNGVLTNCYIDDIFVFEFDYK